MTVAGFNLRSTRGAGTAWGSRADFFSSARGLNSFGEFKSIKRLAIAGVLAFQPRALRYLFSVQATA
jgi:hypothetical protein